VISASRPVYLFGPFALHATKRLLLRGKQVVPLTSKAFETLLALVENARSILAKDDLLRRVWPDAVVEESNLTQSIFMLRKALGDKVAEHRYIVTVPKRGYSFVADVREVREGDEPTPPKAPPLLGRRFPVNAEAHELCLKGRHFWAKRTALAVEKAIRCFEQAIDKEPASAKAYAGLADCYAVLSHHSRLSPRITMPKAKAAGLRALQIDDTLVEAHTSLALVLMLYDWDWPAAEGQFKEALRPGHSYPTAHHWFGMYLVARGRFDEGIAQVERALQLDPLSLAINTDLGLVLYLARRYDEAVRQYQATMELEPDFEGARAGLLMAYHEMGLFHQPVSEFLRTPEALSREAAARLEEAFARAGVTGYWRAYLELSEVPGSGMSPSPYMRARLYAAVGEKARALSWLDTAHAERDGGLSLLKVDPGLDSLRREPHFRSILESVGLG